MSRNSRLVLTGTIVLLLAATLWMAIRSARVSRRGEATALREVVDMTSRTVRIPKRPARILSLCTSATDAIVAAGAADRLVAIDEFSRIVPGTERATVVGKGGAVSREQAAAIRVDLAFVWWYQDEAAAMLEDLAIPVVRIRSGRAAELPAMIRLIGDCVDCREAADRAAAQAESFLAKSPPRPAQHAKRVFLELYGPLKTVGRDTYTNDLLELAGAAQRRRRRQGNGLVFGGTTRSSRSRRDSGGRHGRGPGGAGIASGHDRTESRARGASVRPGPLLARRRPADAPVRREDSQNHFRIAKPLKVP